MTGRGPLSTAGWAATVRLGEQLRRTMWSTGPCDRAAAESAVRELYAVAGIGSPRTVWMDSPLGGVYAWLQQRELCGPRLADGGVTAATRLRADLDDEDPWQGCAELFAAQVHEQGFDRPLEVPSTACEITDSLERAVEVPAERRVEAELGHERHRRIRPAVASALRRGLGRAAHLSPALRLYDGCHRDRVSNLYRTALIRRLLELAGLPRDRRLEAMHAALSQLGRWWPMQGAVVLTEPPTAIRTDANGRAHGATGPAFTYPDGTGVFAWHGVGVPAGFVRGWSLPRIVAEPNVELRRMAIERYGWDRFVADAGLRQVGRAAPDPANPGCELRLYRIPDGWFPPRRRSLLPGGRQRGVRLLLCENSSPDRDGTRRRFGLFVPGTFRNPVAAAAWTFGVGTREYARLARST